MANLILNPCFANGEVDWTFVNGLVVTQTTVTPPAVCGTNTHTALLNTNGSVSQIVDTTVGRLYQLSFYTTAASDIIGLEYTINVTVNDIPVGSFENINSNTFNEFTTTFVATSFSSTVAFSNPTVEVGAYIDGVILVPSSICIHESMLVKTNNGVKLISNIIKGDIVEKFNGDLIPVLFNIKSVPTNIFYKIDKNALGPNEPDQDFYIHGDHPILYNGDETLPKDLIGMVNGISKIRMNHMVDIYSICTEERTFIKICGDLNVCTWSLEDFDKLVENKIWHIKL